MVSLKPVSALRVSKNGVHDIDLTWRQMEIAQATFLQHVAKFHSPEKVVLLIAQSFMSLEIPPASLGRTNLPSSSRARGYDCLNENQGLLRISSDAIANLHANLDTNVYVNANSLDPRP